MQFRGKCGAALLAATAICILPAAAFAADKPATPEGASALGAVFAKYFGKAATSPPNFTVAAASDHYDVAFDYGAALSALTAMMPSQATYAPAIVKLHLTEQDDGAWRIAMDGVPKMSSHLSNGPVVMDSNFEYVGFSQEMVFDPATASIRSGHAAADAIKMKIAGTGFDETMATGPLIVDQASKVSEGEVSLAGKGSVAAMNFALAVRPDEVKAAGGGSAKDANPVNVTGKSDKADVDVAVDGLKTRQGLDLWAFAVAHPTRAELAANEPAFKALLTAFLSNDFKLAENGALQKIAVTAPQGVFGLDSAKIGVKIGVSAQDNFEEHFAGEGFTLPPGLVPPMFADLTPKSFDFGVKVSGFDAAGAAQEAIAAMHLAGDGPPISDADGKKILAKGMAAGGVVVDLPPSHILAAKLDVSYDGQIKFDGSKRSGKVNVHVRNFDQTVEALKALGQMVPPNAMAGLAMAKGLAKKDGDALTWVAEMTADGSISVNGLPLGKAPM